MPAMLAGYLGVRVTLPLEEAHAAIEKLWPALDRSDVFYASHEPHGSEHEGAHHHHVHVVVPYLFAATEGKEAIGTKEKYALQKRINRLEGFTLKGNQCYAVSIYTNEQACAATYMKHDTQAKFFYRSDEVKELIVNAPAWVEKRAHMLPDDGDCNDIHKVDKRHLHKMLTETNIVAVMRKHVRLRKLQRITFPEVLSDLLSHSHWRIGPQLRREKIPIEVVDEFEYGAQAVSQTHVDRYMPYQYKNRLQKRVQ